MNVGGDILEITCNHETLGTFVFHPVANSDFSLDTGGIRGNDDADMVTGSGQNIKQMNNKRWSFEGPFAWDANTREDLETLEAMGADPLDGQWTFSLANGETYAGAGSPVGDIVGNTNTAQIPVKISGGGKLKKQ